MRVRIDAHGHPKPPVKPPVSPSTSTQPQPPNSNTQSTVSSKPNVQPSPPRPSPRPTSVPPLPTKPRVNPPPSVSVDHAKRAAPSRAPLSRPTPRPSSSKPVVSRPAPPRPPTAARSTNENKSSSHTTARPPVPPSTIQLAHLHTSIDDARSDSGSSVATEAYNSEDEHPHPSESAEVPIKTLREREADFSSQLATKGLRIVDMRPDGNCLFRALAYAVWNDAERHTILRATVMQYLVQERDYFSQFVAEDFVRYVRRKSRDGTHGNHLELQAAAELFTRAIEVYSYSATPATIIDAWGTPADPEAAPEPIRLSFHRGSHYNAVQPVNYSEKNAKRAAAAAAAADDAQWRSTHARIQEEIERAVLALSLVEATRGDSAAGSSSASATVPSSVLALVNMGYSEDVASDAYRVAGHGGLPEMIRFVSNGMSTSRRPPLHRQRVRAMSYLSLPHEMQECPYASAQRPVDRDSVQQELHEHTHISTESLSQEGSEGANAAID